MKDREEHWLLRLIKLDEIRILFWLAMLFLFIYLSNGVLPDLYRRDVLSYGAFRFLGFLCLGLLVLSAVIGQWKVGRYIARRPKRAGAFAMIVVGGFLFVMECGAIIRHASPALALVGLCLLAGGFLLLFADLNASGKKKRLKQIGKRHEAKITMAKADSVFVNGRQRSTVFAQDGELEFHGTTFASMEGARGGTIPVLVNPENPGEYCMLFEEITFPEVPAPPSPAISGENGEKPAAECSREIAERIPEELEVPEPVNVPEQKQEREEPQHADMFLIVFSVLFALVGLPVLAFGVYALIASGGHGGNIFMGIMCLASGIICEAIGILSIRQQLRSVKRSQGEKPE